MNEIALSDDLNVITAEINSYKQVAGQSIFEIGRRLKHVKENDLVHGEFGKWLESIGMDKTNANKYIRVYKEFGDSSTYTNLGFNALNLIASMPEQERNKQHEIPSTGESKAVDEMTVKELREVKAKLRQEQRAREQAELSNEKLGLLLTEERNKQPETIEKEVIKEVVPDHVRQQIQEKDRYLKAMKKETKSLQDELKILKAQQPDDIDEELAEHKLKRLEREASIETLEIAVRIQRFLKDSSLSAFQIGALAQSSDSTKAKMHQHIEMLEQFTQNLKSALNGRIQI